MLHPLKVSELLTHNTQLDLYSQIFIMSRDGTLISYSYPADIVSLRDQAAVVAMAWQEKSQPSDAAGANAVRAMTIEDREYNTIARAMRDENILVLTGRADADRDVKFRITIENSGDPIATYQSASIDTVDEPLDSFKLQRCKIEALLKTLESQIGSS